MLRQDQTVIRLADMFHVSFLLLHQQPYIPDRNRSPLSILTLELQHGPLCGIHHGRGGVASNSIG